MKDLDIMKLFYKWLDEKYGDDHPHRIFMKMAWKEAFKQGMENARKGIKFEDIKKRCSLKMEIGSKIECLRRRRIISGLEGCLCKEENCFEFFKKGGEKKR